MKRLDEITIADLMPDSISKDAQVSAVARAIDPQLGLISEAVDKPLILAAIDDLSEGVLEHLAVQYEVTAWDSAWPIETKRAVLKTAIADKRKMGTRGAVLRAIEAVAPIATITEWWQRPQMPPHTFTIDLLQDGSAVDAETQASVIAQVNEAKPVRSHFTFTVGQLLGGCLYFAGVLRAISYARVRSAGIVMEQTSIQAGIFAALRGMAIRRLLASSHMGEMPEPSKTDAEFILVDGETGKITHKASGGEFVYTGETGHYAIDAETEIISTATGHYVMNTGPDIVFVQVTLKAYFNRNNPGAAASCFGSSSSTTQLNRLYDAGSNGLLWESGRTYTIMAVYGGDGVPITGGGTFSLVKQTTSGTDYVRLKYLNGGTAWTGTYIEYTMT